MSAPCRCCGVATDRRVTMTPDLSGPSAMAAGREFEVGVCDECESLRPDDPGAAVRAALRLLGKDESDYARAAKAFEEAGVDTWRLMYVSRNNPQPQRKAWRHVTKEQKRDLRMGWAKVLDLRVHRAADHDREVPPHAPPEGPPACLACGVGLSDQWYTVTTGALTRGPDVLTGCVCSTCGPILRAIGAVGPSFVERACLEFHGLHWSESMRAPGLKAWVATGLEPRDQPWDWVELTPPRPDLTPLQRLQDDVARLSAEVAELRARLA